MIHFKSHPKPHLSRLLRASRAVFLITGLLLTHSAGAVTLNMTPIAVTGWNRDVVIESSASGPPYTNYAAEMNAGEGTAFYQTGTPGFAWGLPPSGAFVSMIGDNTLFQFQPYTTNNALVLSPDTGLTAGTLTLATPASYASLAIVAHSANATNQTGALTLNFQDGSSFTTTYFSPDWFNGTTNVALFGNARVNLMTGGDDGGTINPRYYQTTINVAALLGSTNKPIASLSFGKTQSKSTAIYCVSGLLAGNTPALGTPIAATGYNRDLVVENTAASAPYTGFAAELNPGEGKAFYQSGLAGTTYGLPLDGSFVSAFDGTRFQLQPYTGNNALVLSSDTGISAGNLTLTSPAIYNSLSVLANSAGGGGTPSVTINFQDGSTLNTNINAQDWFGNTINVALQGFDRITLSSGATQGGPTDPRFYQTTFDLAALFGATNKPIASVTFHQATGAGATAIYALSGVRGDQTNGSYTPATVTNAPASGILTRSATLNGVVVAAGGALPEVFIYYGTTDGHTNASAWGQRVSLGLQAGAFSQSVTALTVNTTYYYTVAAINPAGVAWATPSQSFTTAVASSPVITNLPAGNVEATAVVVSGTVLNTGGDAPTVTLFYGPADGGTNPGSWSNSVAFPGVQSGWFGKALTGLSPGTTYFYSARAVNASGTAWGTPLQSFTTAASNGPPPNLIAVLTSRNDNARTGLNTNEASLTVTNVNTNTFGKLFSYPVDGYVLAQPLILPGVNVPGKGVHNIVFVATQHDSIYAFDADNNTGPNAAPLWQVSFINPAAGITSFQSTQELLNSSLGYYGSEVGISGTPVLDPVTGTLYLLAQTKEVAGGVTNYLHRIHALDVATGAEKFGGPVSLQGSVVGLGDGFDDSGHVPFTTGKHMNRPALLLNNGVLCVTFTGHLDYPPYHGWVFTYNAYTLQPLGLLNTTPNGAAGGIWQAANGPAADSAGNIYFETGNGTFDATNGNYGDSVMKLSTTNGLAVADYFTPYNQLALNLQDLDIGSAGLMLLPDVAGSVAHPHLLVAGSKTGVFWLLDRDHLGQFNPAGDTQIVQEISGATRGMWCTPAYFNGELYYAAVGDNVKAFAISNAVLNTTPVSKSTNTLSYPGASVSISANGISNGIVWAIDSSANQNGPAVLRAYNATNLAQELYNSSMMLARDNPGNAIKYTTPTIANGKVYVGTVNALSVFGNSSFLAAPAITPNGGTFTNSVQVFLSGAVNGAAIYYTLDGTTPTTNSTLYTGPFVLTQNTGVRAVVTLPGSPDSSVAAATFIYSASLGAGAGLLGQYFGSTTPGNPFIGSPLVRTDATVNFNWNSVSPDPSIPASNYTVRWTGLVQPFFSENYTFSTTTDDGVRLWVNGQLLIDHWTPQSPTTWTGSIPMQAQQLYSIEMDYFQGQGGAVAQLAWSSPSTVQSIIPTSQLYPASTPPPILLASPSAFTNGAFQLQVAGMAGKNYILEGSTDLLNWIQFSTNVAPSNLFYLIDSNAATYPHRFYRTLQQP